MNFDRVARRYRWLEAITFGNQLQQARIAFVRHIEPPRHALIVGEGDGRFLAEFVRRYSESRIDCVEASARMIELSRARIGDAPQVNFLHADFQEILLESKRYDLIVTHFFLDCFDRAALREVVSKVASVATSDAQWLVADFRHPRSGWRRGNAQLSVWAMYRFFRLTSGLETQGLEDPSPLIKEAGFERVRQRRTRFGMIKSEFWRRMPGDLREAPLGK